LPITYSSLVTIPNTSGVAHSTGVIPFDVTGDRVTDLVFFPTTFNSGSNLPTFSIANNRLNATYADSIYWNKSFSTGFVKDWLLTDLNRDGKQDIVWVDHGLELSPSQGGFQNGINASLLSNASQILAYSTLPGELSFYHGAALSSDVSLLVANFTNELLQYTYQNNSFIKKSLSLNGDFGYANPGAVGVVKMKSGESQIVASSYQAPNQYHLTGQHILYSLAAGGTISKADAVPFPASWNTNNLGAFSIISGDFRNVGYDDILVLGETASLANYTRDVRYLKQENGKFSDATQAMLGSVADLINQPDKLIPFDVNHDGHLDLIGFSYKQGSYTSGFGLFLNNGLGQFKSVNFGDQSFKNSQNYPIFSTNADGSWDSLIGLYGVSTPNTSKMSVTQWLVDSTLFSGPNWINPALKGAPGFNEIFYINNYGDAAAAVTSGRFASGLDYYLAIGKPRGDLVCAPGTKIYGSSGNNSPSFANGAEVFAYHGVSTQYTINLNAVGDTVLSKAASSPISDTFYGICRLKFTDTNLALDVGPTENAGSVYMLYKAAFNRAPDAGGMGYWLAQKDSGKDIVTNLAQGFVNSPEFIAKYGSNPSNASYVDKLYQNVLGRAGESGGVAYWNGELDAGRISKAAVLVQFATLPEGAANVASLIANGISYTEYVG
jgi:hypothetical protein